MSCAAGLLALLAAGCGSNSRSAAPQPANILLITLDTTRADALNCYSPLRPKGRRAVETPHFDALAARGALFADATAQVPLTLPSHASIMTGKYPPVHGLRDMEGFVLSASHTTLATASRRAGFATAAFVGSRVLARQFGLAGGFDVYDDAMSRQSGNAGEADLHPERRAAEVTERALEWLRSNSERRFFLWVHYFDPHAPYDPPEPFARPYTEDSYSGEVAYVDEQAGRLFRALDEMGLGSRTLAAVIGDHGESLGEHGETTHGVFLYESTLDIPFILAGPDIPAGKVVREQVRSIDLLPTLLDLAGLPHAAGLQGVSLRSLMERGAADLTDYSYSETLYPRTYMGWSELSAMRTGKWKLIAAPRPELYDLENDPRETRNVLAEHPAEADRLRARIRDLETARNETAAPGPMDANTRRQLESLGYISGGTPRRSRPGAPAPDPKDRIQVLQILARTEDLLNRNQYARAAALMEDGLRLDPTNPRCHLALAMAYEQMGQYNRALQVFQRALARQVETDKIYSRLGIDYLHLGQYEKGAAALAEASRLNPADVHTLRNLGMAYLQLNRINDAERVFRAITGQDPAYAAAHNGLGVAAARRGDAEAARRAFEKAIQVDPNELKSVLDLGILYQNIGDRQRAVHYLELFLSKVPAGQFTQQLPAIRAAIKQLRVDNQ